MQSRQKKNHKKKVSDDFLKNRVKLPTSLNVTTETSYGVDSLTWQVPQEKKSKKKNKAKKKIVS